MNILFIGKRFYTSRDALHDRYGRIYQLPRHWADEGKDVQLWLIDYRTKESARAMHGRLRIVSTPVFRVDFAQHALAALVCARPRVDLVVGSGDCYIGILALLVARRMRARFVFDVYDRYDEFSGYRTLPGFDLFRYIVRQADVRLFASRAVMEQMSSAVEGNVLVPNGVDSQRFSPLDMQESRSRTGLPLGVTLIGYFGGMEQDRGVADLVAAVQMLRAQGMKLELVLGGGNAAGFNTSQEGVRYVGDVPFAQMPEMLASCDLLAVPYRRSTFMDAGASNKIAEAIACARPLVATKTPNFMLNFGDQAELLGHRLAEPSNVQDLARVIAAQSRDRVLVTMPEGMDWLDIATRTLEQIG